MVTDVLLTARRVEVVLRRRRARHARERPDRAWLIQLVAEERVVDARLRARERSGRGGEEAETHRS